MKTYLKNAQVVNVFTDMLEKADVLIEDGFIASVGECSEDEADEVIDVSGKIICPSFIDSHIHIESTMLTPEKLADVCVPHGTGAIVADPHEIANVCGTEGIKFMLEHSENLPMDVYIMASSCVPATGFDEAGAVLKAGDLKEFYNNPRVLGLAEMMNYPGVLAGDPDCLEKIRDAKAAGKRVNGHAIGLTGRNLEKYIAAGVTDDHECTTFRDAEERIRKGQWIQIREGTSARNVEALLPLFGPHYSHRCMLATDDRHPSDLLKDGHIDSVIRRAVSLGASPLAAIRMASIQTAEYYNIPDLGAVAPGYRANLLVLDNLDEVRVNMVFKDGVMVASEGKILSETPSRSAIPASVRSSFNCGSITPESFRIDLKSEKAHVIQIVPGQLITLDYVCNPRDEEDVLKLAVIERHHGTGHMGLGYIKGIGLKQGAIASSVSHDSHNLIVIGTNDADMSLAANRIAEIGGGNVLVVDGKVVCEMALPIAGLMSEKDAAEASEENRNIRDILHSYGVPADVEPFMNMAFVSLPVIPSLKMTTLGLFNVDKFELCSLEADR